MCCGVIPILFGWFLRVSIPIHALVFIRIIRVGLSGTALRKCVCMLVCLLVAIYQVFKVSKFHRKAHRKKLHLGSEMDMERLMDMLSSSQLEVLSKFKNIFKPYS